MKKFILAALSVLMLSGMANAQLNEEIKLSRERAEKLQKMCDDYKRSGNSNVDGFGDAVKDAAVLAIAKVFSWKTCTNGKSVSLMRMGLSTLQTTNPHWKSGQHLPLQ